MHYAITTPPTSRPAERLTPIDDALVAEARRLLSDTVASLPFTSQLSGPASEALFATSMTALCAAAGARDVPVEKLLVAIKLAWASLPEVRFRLGEAAPDALSGAVSSCIKAYFASAGQGSPTARS
jgi:hypothetical protein